MFVFYTTNKKNTNIKLFQHCTNIENLTFCYVIVNDHFKTNTSQYKKTRATNKSCGLTVR